MQLLYCSTLAFFDGIAADAAKKCQSRATGTDLLFQVVMLTLLSPAKLNLFLRILFRRPDGYHELASLFQAIDLYDVIHYRLSEVDSLTCNDSTIPTDGTNLVLKAADLFRRKTGLKTGVEAHLEKNIPHQAGFGGGSGNAATTLWALNQLCGKPATVEQLSMWAGEIGSDISFFLSQGCAYCTGRGEQMRSIAPLPIKRVTLFKPSEGLATPQVYRTLKVDNLSPRNPQESLNCFLSGKGEYYNDLEPPAFELMPSLALLKQKLQNAGFDHVLLSGSGTGFFCLGQGNFSPANDMFSVEAQYVSRPYDRWYGEK